MTNQLKAKRDNLTGRTRCAKEVDKTQHMAGDKKALMMLSEFKIIS